MNTLNLSETRKALSTNRIDSGTDAVALKIENTVKNNENGATMQQLLDSVGLRYTDRIQYNINQLVIEGSIILEGEKYHYRR